MQRFAALDTDFLIGVRDGVEDCAEVMDWLQTIRLFPIVSETVIQELTDIADLDNVEDNRQMADEILHCVSTWLCITPKLAPIVNGIAEQVANKIMKATGLDKNQSLVIAEAACHECTLLVTNDRKILEAEEDHLNLVLVESDVSDVTAVSPQDLVKYLRSKKAV